MATVASSQLRYDINFPYGINTDEIAVTTTQNSNVVTTAGSVALTAGNTYPCTASLTLKAPVYVSKANESDCTFTATFDSVSPSGCVQLVGIGDTSQGLFVGYDLYGMFHLRAQGAGQPQLYYISISGTPTLAGTVTLTLNGKTFTYAIGLGVSMYTALTAVANDANLLNANYMTSLWNSGVYINTLSAFPQTSAPTISFSGAGLTTSITSVLSGIAPTVYAAYQAPPARTADPNETLFPWNGSGVQFLSSFSPQSTNQFTIRQNQYSVGSAGIYLVDPVTYVSFLLHTFFTTSALPAPSSLAPSASCINYSSNSSVKMLTNGFSIVSNNPRSKPTLPTYTIYADVAGNVINGNLNTLLTLGMPPVFNGRRNYLSAYLQSIKITLSSASACHIDLRKSCTYSAVTAMTPPYTNAALQYDSAAYTVTGGTVVDSWFATTQPQTVQSTFQNVFISPGNTLTLCIGSVGTVSASLSSYGITLSWIEI